MDYLLKLNDKQLEAVQSTEGYLRVIAGAGSGKTKLLVSRYAYNNWKYSLDNVFCVEVYETKEAAMDAAFEALERKLSEDK